VTGDWTQEEQAAVLARLGYSPRSPEEAAEDMRTPAAREELKRLRATPLPAKVFILTDSEREPLGVFTSELKAFAAVAKQQKQRRIIEWQEDLTVGRVTGNRLWHWVGYLVREMDVQ
jgi:hypothetical protein